MTKPLFWHQGLFLQPQHFQLNDLHLQSIVTPLYRCFQPHPWGVANLSIRESALNNATIEIAAGEFIFPDNTHAELFANATIQSRSFGEAWTDGSKTFTVFVGLKKFNFNRGNVTVVPDPSSYGEITTRFVSAIDSNAVKDLHQTGPEAQVKQMDLVLRILWESELDQLGDFLLIPIALLEKNGDKIQLSKEFIPPCLTIEASHELSSLIREIFDQLGARTRQLEMSKKRQGGPHSRVWI